VFANGHDRRTTLLNHCSNLFGFMTHILRIQAVHNHDFRRSARTEYQALGHPQESSGRHSRPFGDYQPQRRLPAIQSVDRGIPLMATPDRQARDRWPARNPHSAIPRSRAKPLRATAAGRHGDLQVVPMRLLDIGRSSDSEFDSSYSGQATSCAGATVSISEKAKGRRAKPGGLIRLNANAAQVRCARTMRICSTWPRPRPLPIATGTRS